jgi:tRNA (guanine-N7-)-methyltransferase
MDETGAERLIHTYGRRRGRRLRPGQRVLLAAMLPEIAIGPASSESLDPCALFAPAPRAVWLEVGFGGGEHLAAQAAANPHVGFIGCEPFVNGVVSLLGHVSERGLRNVRVWQGDARDLIARLPEASIRRAFILFPDPWPKARHHKRRLIAPAFLDALARVLGPGAELRVATDDMNYLAWSLERLTAHPAFRWCARGPADWRHRSADWPPTRYEQKAIAAGRKPVYLRFVRVPEDHPGAIGISSETVRENLA